MWALLCSRPGVRRGAPSSSAAPMTQPQLFRALSLVRSRSFRAPLFRQEPQHLLALFAVLQVMALTQQLQPTGAGWLGWLLQLAAVLLPAGLAAADMQGAQQAGNALYAICPFIDMLNHSCQEEVGGWGGVGWGRGFELPNHS